MLEATPGYNKCQPEGEIAAPAAAVPQQSTSPKRSATGGGGEDSDTNPMMSPQGVLGGVECDEQAGCPITVDPASITASLPGATRMQPAVVPASAERRAAAEQEQRSTGGPGLMDPTDNPMQLVDQAPDQHETTSHDLGGADLAAEQLAAAARSEHEGLDLRDPADDEDKSGAEGRSEATANQAHSRSDATTNQWTDAEGETLMRIVSKHLVSAGELTMSAKSERWQAIVDELGTGRTTNAVYHKWLRTSTKAKANVTAGSAMPLRWTLPEVDTLMKLVEKRGTCDWEAVSAGLGSGRSAKAVRTKYDDLTRSTAAKAAPSQPSVSQSSRVRKAVDSFDPVAEAKRPQLAAKAAPSQPSVSLGSRLRKAVDSFDPVAEAKRPQLAGKAKTVQQPAHNTDRSGKTAASKCTDAVQNMSGDDDDLDGVDSGASNRWTEPEIDRLMRLVKKHRSRKGSCNYTCNWESVAAALGKGRTAKAVREKHAAILKKQHANSNDSASDKNLWTEPETDQLMQLVETYSAHGEKSLPAGDSAWGSVTTRSF